VLIFDVLLANDTQVVLAVRVATLLSALIDYKAAPTPLLLQFLIRYKRECVDSAHGKMIKGVLENRDVCLTDPSLTWVLPVEAWKYIDYVFLVVLDAIFNERKLKGFPIVVRTPCLHACVYVCQCVVVVCFYAVTLVSMYVGMLVWLLGSNAVCIHVCVNSMCVRVYVHVCVCMCVTA
jgi:hypothetical protein